MGHHRPRHARAVGVVRAAVILAVLTPGCETKRGPAPSSSPANGVSPGVSRPPPSPDAASIDTAPASADAAPQGTAPPANEDSAYPIGDTCRDPQALAREKRSLPPRKAWETVTSAKQRITVDVPPSVFKVTDDDAGLHLVSAVKAAGLGPDAKPRPFAIHLRQLDESIDALLADKSKASPLDGLYVEGAFPKRTVQSFAPFADSHVGPGFAMELSLSKKPAWVFVSGGHGYNTDAAIVRVGPRDTVLARADWNSAVMMGQPECWQRTLIAGVIESLTVR